MFPITTKSKKEATGSNARRSILGVNAESNKGETNPTRNKPLDKSKFTDHKPLTGQSQPPKCRNFTCNKTINIKPTVASSAKQATRLNSALNPHAQNNRSAQREQKPPATPVWRSQRANMPPKPKMLLPPCEILKPISQPDPVVEKKLTETGVQTNETEILNHDLIVGDVKLMMASQGVISNISAERRALRKLEQAARRYEAHEAEQSQRLTDLREFLETATISRRKNNRNNFSQDKSLFNSMDTLFSKEVTKTESFSNIKGRIKQKENELLSLFDNMAKIDRSHN